MNPVYVFQHAAGEGPGYLGDYLNARGIPFVVMNIHEGVDVPISLRGVAGLVFMGGPMSANDPLPWIEDELNLIRRAHWLGIPVLGHCLGGQLISKALSGEVTRNPVAEIGWHPVAIVEESVHSPWLSGLPARFEVFHWHEETFSIPGLAMPLFQSEFCQNQAFAQGNTLALQCHVEITADMLRDWVEPGQSRLPPPSASAQGPEEMTRDLEARIAALHRVADRLYGYWIEGLIS